MDFPFISFVIPAYNCEATIASCLGSISKQSCNNYEVIIVNDASLDRTVSVVKRFKQHNPEISLALYNLKENSGVGVARATGASLAKGKFLWFLDSDDQVAAPNAVAELYKTIYAYKGDEPPIIVFDSLYVRLNSGGYTERVVSNNACSPAKNQQEFLELLLRREASLVVWDKVFPRTLIEPDKLSGLRRGEDKSQVIQLATKASVGCVYLPLVLYCYKADQSDSLSGGALTFDSLKFKLQSLEEVHQHIEKLKLGNIRTVRDELHVYTIHQGVIPILRLFREGGVGTDHEVGELVTILKRLVNTTMIRSFTHRVRLTYLAISLLVALTPRILIKALVRKRIAKGK